MQIVYVIVSGIENQASV